MGEEKEKTCKSMDGSSFFFLGPFGASRGAASRGAAGPAGRRRRGEVAASCIRSISPMLHAMPVHSPPRPWAHLAGGDLHAILRWRFKWRRLGERIIGGETGSRCLVDKLSSSRQGRGQQETTALQVHMSLSFRLEEEESHGQQSLFTHPLSSK